MDTHTRSTEPSHDTSLPGDGPAPDLNDGLSPQAYNLITYARRAMVDHGVIVELGDATLRFLQRRQEFSDDRGEWFRALEAGLFMKAQGTKGAEQFSRWIRLGSSDDAHEMLAPYVRPMTDLDIECAKAIITGDVVISQERRATTEARRKSMAVAEARIAVAKLEDSKQQAPMDTAVLAEALRPAFEQVLLALHPGRREVLAREGGDYKYLVACTSWNVWRAAVQKTLEQPTADPRLAFEHWFSDEGAWPAAVERAGAAYKLQQASMAWSMWAAAAAAVQTHEQKRMSQTADSDASDAAPVAVRERRGG